MSLMGRVAAVAVLLSLAGAVVGLVLLRPLNEEDFSRQSDDLQRSAAKEFEQIAGSLVDDIVTFGKEAALSSSRKSVAALEDLSLDLFRNASGVLSEERLREALREILSQPVLGGADREEAIRAEVRDRALREVARRLEALRPARQQAAAGHAQAAAWRTLAAWGGLILVLFAGGAFLLDRWIVRPVGSVTEAVARFGAGDRGVRLPVAGDNEIAALAAAFNHTAEQVEHTERENESLRSELEQKVRERTAALVRAARAASAGTLAGGVAHEFNNLLGGILGCSDAALAEKPGRDVKELLQMIRKTALRGVGVTDALLRATRAEPDLRACRLDTLLEEVVAEARPPDEIELRRDLAPVEVLADAPMLRQVFGNLVRNAVHAMRGGGTLTLLAVANEEGARCEVGDTGGGIDPAVQGVLFEPFVTTRPGGREGTGLGLFLADRLVAAHGGRIEVESAPGQGALFRVLLPREGLPQGDSARNS